MSDVPYPVVQGTEPCRTGDPDRFFPESGTQYRAAAVKAECQPCPLRGPCLAWALHNGEPGIWGGTTPHERSQLRRQWGIRAVSPQSTHVDREQVARMAGRGTPNHVIAEALGVQRELITRILRERRQQVAS